MSCVKTGFSEELAHPGFHFVATSPDLVCFLFFRVFSFLDVVSLCRCAQVSKVYGVYFVFCEYRIFSLLSPGDLLNWGWAVGDLIDP